MGFFLSKESRYKALTINIKMMNNSVVHALLAAALFGASTPFAKLLIGESSPVLLAGLLYLGSGIGLTLVRLVRDQGWKPSGLVRSEWPWLLGAILFGGVLGPVALLFGLMTTSGSTASLLLNLEAVLTAVIAWFVFRENADRRIVLSMMAIVAGGVVLSWPAGEGAASGWLGPLAVAVACLCWAIDNNLTRKVSAFGCCFHCKYQGFAGGNGQYVACFFTGCNIAQYDHNACPGVMRRRDNQDKSRTKSVPSSALGYPTKCSNHDYARIAVWGSWGEVA